MADPSCWNRASLLHALRCSSARPRTRLPCGEHLCATYAKQKPRLTLSLTCFRRSRARLAPPMALSISTSNFRLQGSSPLRPLTRSLHTHSSQLGDSSTSFVNAVMPCDKTASYTTNSSQVRFNLAYTATFDINSPRVYRTQPRTYYFSRYPAREPAQSRPDCAGQISH
jgi:hypothetical protein